MLYCIKYGFANPVLPPDMVNRAGVEHARQPVSADFYPEA
jgi:hypothetical protein